LLKDKAAFFNVSPGIVQARSYVADPDLFEIFENLKSFMQSTISIQFTNIFPDLQDIIVAELNEIGFEAFEQSPIGLSAFIPADNFVEPLLKVIAQQHSLSYTIQTILPANWNEEWEKSFEPVTIDNFCSIRASFHPPGSNAIHDIIITPKMSFGTGHHATTFLMVTIMRSLDMKNKRVLDFGTGTGILAILAEKCGATSVLAIDNDDWSIENAKENISANACKKILLQLGGSLEMNENFEVILANINKHVIKQQLTSIVQHLENDGVLILSGLLESDRNDIEIMISNTELSIIDVVELNDWIALTCKSGQAFSITNQDQ